MNLEHACYVFSRRLRMFFVVGFAIFSIACHSRCPTVISEMRPEMTQLEREVADKLRVFKESRSLDALREAANAVDSFSTSQDWTSSENEFRRTEIAKLWLEIIDSIDRSLIPNFNFEDVPLLTVIPPPSVALPAGVAPEAIKDPVARREYEEAIRLNQVKAAQYRFQKMLRKLDTQISELARQYFMDSYGGVGGLDEFNVLVDRYISNDKRRKELKELFDR